MKRILRFSSFLKEDSSYMTGVYGPPGLSAGKTPFIRPMDPDQSRREVEGGDYELRADVLQFDPVKTLEVMADEPYLKKVLTFFLSGDFDAEHLIKHPTHASPVEVELLRDIFDNIIMKDLSIRKKYQNI